MKREILCVIPARSGSVRVKHKNIKPLMGRPLLSYPILTALKSRYVTRVIVSTDSPEYARIARKWGAEVPFLRPKELAEDVPSELVLRHAVEWLEENEGYRADPIVLMQCTTPLTSVEDLDGCIEMFFKTGADTVITVREVKDNPRWMFWMTEENRLHSYIGLSGEHLKGRWADSKLHSKLYVPTGGVYIVKRSVLLEKGRIYGDDIRGYIVPVWRGWDIDELEDFYICQGLAFYLKGMEIFKKVKER